MQKLWGGGLEIDGKSDILLVNLDQFSLSAPKNR